MNNGIDTVVSAGDFRLSDGVENLILTGRARLGEGNYLDNHISGDNASLYGYGGDDVLSGDRSRLTGGTGSDTFKLSISSTNPSIVMDFSVGVDRIAVDFDVRTEYFIVGTEAMDADDYLIYNSGTGVLYYDSDASGIEEQKEIALLADRLDLTAQDFDSFV
ncbi:MAG: hypothetical protein SGJ17_04085 [Hyphomicrobiales bacterium]|nr:hypothetical protein [Hyphomicrobiales bacterium]